MCDRCTRMNWRGLSERARLLIDRFGLRTSIDLERQCRRTYWLSASNQSMSATLT